MSVLAVPNVSEGRDPSAIGNLAAATQQGGARLLDVHSDQVHHRTVFTLVGKDMEITTGVASLAVRARDLLDLTAHDGAHPRVGVLDVCPIVPLDDDMDAAAAVAIQVAERIAAQAGLPVFLYGRASPSGRTLPEIRKGGLEALVGRVDQGLRPDAGPSTIDPRHGVVCVGARGVLIAFNVLLRATTTLAREIAASVRVQRSGLTGVRAIGLPGPDPDTAQVSMNLTEPDATGIDDAFAVVAAKARAGGADVVSTELVGLVPRRHQPMPDAEAARLLIEPSRSLETLLGAKKP